MRLITVVMFVCKMVVGMIFYGLTLGASAVDIDPFLYMAISGLVELPVPPGSIVLIRRLGYKKAIIAIFTLCALFLLVQPMIPEGRLVCLPVRQLLGASIISLFYNYLF